ncbi:heterokaryon incompatibility protein-domain-containing protein [Cubamyces menziesii]|nr:heterokaryon incompatibility protein-domain-containing protein [Cubamyces menziesii]
MYLLNTHTGKLKNYQHTDGIRYAILSHVWDPAGEQSYAEVVGLWRPETVAVAANESFSIIDNAELSQKIQNACKVAREDGYDFIWIDSCCINKESSAELSEAINSMYAWYQKADVCYAFLADVPDVLFASPGVLSDEVNFRFQNSRWHFRGWTLQELIAPRRVIFLSQTWSVFGCKRSLATVLEIATGVDAAILTGEATLDSVSVARRMSWASKRETKRIEDQAYSLMGIFGVYMPTIYGEEEHAFLRLQQEIIKTIPDQSIFAWGPRSSLPVRSGSTLDRRKSDLDREAKGHLIGPCWGLLAPAPLFFEDSGDISVMSEREFSSCLPPDYKTHALPDIHCSFTSQGARMEMLCIRTPISYTPPDLKKLFNKAERLTMRERCPCIRTIRSFACVVAILRCQDASRRPLALLLLQQSDLPSTQDKPEPSNGTRIVVCGSHHEKWRTVTLPEAEVLQTWRAATPPASSFAVVTLDIRPMLGTPPSNHASNSSIHHTERHLAPGDHEMASNRGYSLLTRAQGLPIFVRIQPWCLSSLALRAFRLTVSSDGGPVAKAKLVHEELGIRVHLACSVEEKFGPHLYLATVNYRQKNGKIYPARLSDCKVDPAGHGYQSAQTSEILRRTGSSRSMRSAQFKLPLPVLDSADTAISIGSAEWHLRITFDQYASTDDQPATTVWVCIEFCGLSEHAIPSKPETPQPPQVPRPIRRLRKRSAARPPGEHAKPEGSPTQLGALSQLKTWSLPSVIKRCLSPSLPWPVGNW